MHILNGQLMFLDACFADKIMAGSRIKQDDNGMSVKRKLTCEDLLTLGNILHGSIVDATGLDNGNLLVTTWWMVDVAMSGVLLRSGAVSGKIASTTTVEVDGVKDGSSSQWRRQAQHRRLWC
jgi:hypothetical protein